MGSVTSNDEELFANAHSSIQIPEPLVNHQKTTGKRLLGVDPLQGLMNFKSKLGKKSSHVSINRSNNNNL